MSQTQKELLLEKYLKKFTSLRRDNKNGGAPHKPILLLSVIEVYEDRIFHNNQVFIIPELVANFKRIWAQLVDTNHHSIFALPFYHMKSEGFWKLIPNYGFEKLIASKASLKSSFNTLKASIYCAEIDQELCELLKNENHRNILKVTLLEKYFPNTKTLYKKEISDDTSFLFKSEKRYFKELEHLKERLDPNNYEEDIFVRSGIFKREIPKLYNYTCAISDMKVDAMVNANLVDACHIVPFSISHDDTVRNGITLCPNLHRAYDRGLIFINENYELEVNNNFVENEDSSYNIKQYEGKKIRLPDNPKYQPKVENLMKHKAMFN